ncbi:LacI family DNA-binding transcriptional regulator [Luteolibacter algae]|uniref:LacI family DNA-binding transcriptional regulator n=1 Tax=Luteolibacter algae TaxID=454151 RepID=A0ABW5D9L0_9BACT
MSGKTTITDIAKALNVSTATVSRALNSSRLVTTEVAELVCRTAEEMGYKKRAIRRHRGRAILNVKLILPRHDEAERTLFYDLSALINGVQSGFTECGINLLCETASKDFKLYPHKKGGDINGFLFAFNQPSPETIAELRSTKTPFAIINRSYEDLPCIASENARGMESLIDHLLARGRYEKLKPCYLTIKEMGQVCDERRLGLAASCKEKGIDFSMENDVYIYESIPAIDSAAAKELAAKYNAILCMNDIMGTVLLTELDRLNIRVPDDLSVTGFDNSPVRKLSRPMLTTVSMPVAELAKAAAARLETEIIEHFSPEAVIRVPGTLMLGEST